MQLLQNALKLFCLVLFCALAACTGGSERQQKPPQAASSQDTIAVDTAKTFKEKYAGYEFQTIEHKFESKTEKQLPVMYCGVDTCPIYMYQRIQFKPYTIREDTAAYAKLPALIQAYCGNHGIRIPYWRGELNASNVLTAEFKVKEQKDLAVLCIYSDTCSIIYFWNQDTINPTAVNPLPIKQNRSRYLFLNDNESRGLRGGLYDINSYSNESFTNNEESYNYYFWPEQSPAPQQFHLYGICDLVYGKYDFVKVSESSYYHYFDGERLLTWGDNAPGYKEWKEDYYSTIPDSLLVNPIDCEGLPPDIAAALERRGMQIVVTGDNPCCLSGQFIEAGRTDYFLHAHQYNDTTAKPNEILMLLCIGGRPDSIIELSKYHFSFSDNYTEHRVAPPSRIENALANPLSDVLLYEDIFTVNGDDSVFIELPIANEGILVLNTDPFFADISYWYIQNGNLWSIYFYDYL